VCHRLELEYVYFRIAYKVISICYDMDMPCNIVICYGKPHITVTVDRGHSYIRMLVFPRRPVTGKPQDITQAVFYAVHLRFQAIV